MKAWIILPCLSGSGWWCNGVRDFFLAHFGPLVPIEHRLNKPRSTWVLLLTMFIPLWLQCTIFWCTSSRIMQHVTKHLRLVSWTWQWVHFTQMASTVTRSQFNRALWDVVEREIHIMDVQPTNLQQLCDAIISICTKISEECFQNLVESMPRRIKAVLKATRY